MQRILSPLAFLALVLTDGLQRNRARDRRREDNRASREFSQLTTLDELSTGSS